MLGAHVASAKVGRPKSLPRKSRQNFGVVFHTIELVRSKLTSPLALRGFAFYAWHAVASAKVGRIPVAPFDLLGLPIFLRKSSRPDKTATVIWKISNLHSRNSTRH